MAKLLTPSNLRTARFTMTGLDEYIEKIQKMGKNIDEVVAEAVRESAKPIHNDLKAWAEKHKLTGDTLEGLVMTDVSVDDTSISVEIGFDANASPNAWHAVFVEHGTPKQPADPGVRRAFDENKKLVKKIQREIIRKAGVPVD